MKNRLLYCLLLLCQPVFAQDSLYYEFRNAQIITDDGTPLYADYIRFLKVGKRFTEYKMQFGTDYMVTKLKLTSTEVASGQINQFFRAKEIYSNAKKTKTAEVSIGFTLNGVGRKLLSVYLQKGRAGKTHYYFQSAEFVPGETPRELVTRLTTPTIQTEPLPATAKSTPNNAEGEVFWFGWLIALSFVAFIVWVCVKVYQGVAKRQQELNRQREAYYAANPNALRPAEKAQTVAIPVLAMGGYILLTAFFMYLIWAAFDSFRDGGVAWLLLGALVVGFGIYAYRSKDASR